MEIDTELAETGVRGTVAPAPAARRVRSTRRRQDTSDLPRRPVENRTLGKAYTAPDGRTFRPSLFLTLTLPSYGRVRADGTPVDPTTHEPLPTWDDALDQLDDEPEAQPAHVLRFGPQLDAQGVLVGSPQAARCVRYLTKYLTKSVAECHTPTGTTESDHVDRLAAELRHEPCSPTCANWLLHGIQPKNAHPACRSRTHKREHLGYGGRRVLVSRKRPPWNTPSRKRRSPATSPATSASAHPGRDGSNP
ncbi:replication initiator [Kitasatospora purpeofusca]|uniref:replication initiator n=1 Tax=Kitasatospora purpeofusca TaxID=67352 RepID=UPI0030EFDA3A